MAIFPILCDCENFNKRTFGSCQLPYTKFLPQKCMIINDVFLNVYVSKQLRNSIFLNLHELDSSKGPSHSKLFDSRNHKVLAEWKIRTVLFSNIKTANYST